MPEARYRLPSARNRTRVERDDAFREEGFRVPVERRRDAQNRPAASHRDVEGPNTAPPGSRSAIGPESSTTRPLRSRASTRSTLFTVQVDQRARGINAQTTRIDDPGVIAERADELAVGVEGEHRIMATAVDATCTGDEEAHQVMLTRVSSGFSPACRPEQEWSGRSLRRADHTQSERARSVQPALVGVWLEHGE